VTEDEQRERIGSALRALAADLAAEKRHVMLLKRENQQLRAELAVLRAEADAEASPPTGRSASPSPAG
jgi:predicted phage gp36 major capsid-like protein